jgi:RimJ/RimL family protein N-acetyltransferase
MTAALGTLIKNWAIPRMGVCRMRVNTFIGNEGSVRVFEKNGFVLVGRVEDCIEVRGAKDGLNILEWKLEDQRIEHS